MGLERESEMSCLVGCLFWRVCVWVSCAWKDVGAGSIRPEFQFRWVYHDEIKGVKNAEGIRAGAKMQRIYLYFHAQNARNLFSYHCQSS